ncbi:Uncharacterized protein APZ42_027699 [Daphnia magna]|uniref:Uncharacterized protein n=1 Tax=Daphnia magna TaxID=35525 RepID=A0A0P5U9A2_9CRUS|nr:Uncharacterized protein APZ42_027699 [Daphnia magna]
MRRSFETACRNALKNPVRKRHDSSVNCAQGAAPTQNGLYTKTAFECVNNFLFECYHRARLTFSNSR